MSCNHNCKLNTKKMFHTKFIDLMMCVCVYIYIYLLYNHIKLSHALLQCLFALICNNTCDYCAKLSCYFTSHINIPHGLILAYIIIPQATFGIYIILIEDPILYGTKNSTYLKSQEAKGVKVE
jgi:hypothetical protein